MRKAHITSTLALAALALASSQALAAQDIDPANDAQVRQHTYVPNTNQHGCDYPRVDDQRRVYFRIEAPNVSSFKVNLGTTFALVKDANGVWTGRSEPLPVGLHYYRLDVDGYNTPDQHSETFYGWLYKTSAVEVAEGAEGDYYRRQNVPHGQLRTMPYWSRSQGRWRECHVYAPPAYDVDNGKRYPVLYLQHGMSEDETSWRTAGHVAEILDNLIAQKKAVPMLIVMDSGDIETPFQGGFSPEDNARREAYGASFRTVLVDELVPAIDSAFRTLPDMEHRAMAGLSWGGKQTFDITMTHPEMFSYIGGFSGALFGVDVDKAFNGIFNDAKAFNKRVHVLFLGSGTEENMGTDKLVEALRGKGINVAQFKSQGTAHEWLTWRRCLREFAPLIFKK